MGHSRPAEAAQRSIPAERPRLVEIRDNLVGRIGEAKRVDWLGEVEGLEASLAGARDKLVQMDAAALRTSAAVDLGMPAFTKIAGCVSATCMRAGCSGRRCRGTPPSSTRTRLACSPP
ncbi:hypothetical protein OG413_27795 [Streptomyces sp. NBC_01433]|uniref:hypothetical protein n=1 Tax=Streptomyces sp. NBC_01433 TaxID=2903864 RepID=UPI00224FF2F3|nr:hypothetical protein [Streptomyces sp. NBC_01433]MCX4679066.1 hypothetical protein [Streptomyces sp. NBC_01433]